MKFCNNNCLFSLLILIYLSFSSEKYYLILIEFIQFIKANFLAVFFFLLLFYNIFFIYYLLIFSIKILI